MTLEHGRTLALAAALYHPKRGAEAVKVEWSILDRTLASVDASGVVRLEPDARGEVVVEARWGQQAAQARIRVAPLSAAAAGARALEASIGAGRIALFLDARTGLAYGENDEVLQWQDARGPELPAALPFGAPPRRASGADGRAVVRFDGLTQGLRTTERFSLDSMASTPSIVYVGTTWGDGVATMLGETEDGPGLGITLRPNPRRLYGRNGMVMGFAGLVESPVANGPGDRQKSARIRVHEVRHFKDLLYARSPLADRPTAPAPRQAGDAPLLIGRSPDGAFNADDVCAVLVMLSFPTSEELERIMAWARAEHGSVSGARRLAVFGGDSIVNGLDLPDARGSFPTQLMERATLRGWDDLTVARGGISAFQLLQTPDYDVDRYYDASRERNVFVVMAGTNDIAFHRRSGAQAYADLRTYCEGRRTKGFRVVVLSMIARNAGPDFERERQAFLSLLRADHSFADAMVDVAAEPRLGAPDAWAVSTWFQDGVHPTPAGYRLIADMVEPVLLAL